MSFTAVDQCPKCKQVEVHWLDEPHPPPTNKDRALYQQKLLEWQESPLDEIVAWGAGVVRKVRAKPTPRPPLDESEFETMRVCVKCGHRWGVK